MVAGQMDLEPTGFEPRDLGGPTDFESKDSGLRNSEPRSSELSEVSEVGAFLL